MSAKKPTTEPRIVAAVGRSVSRSREKLERLLKEASERRHKGGEKTAGKRKSEAEERAKTLRAEAAKIEKMEPGIKKEAVAATLADRGWGGKDAIAKILRPKNRRRSA